MLSELTDTQRTTAELVKAMNSLIEFIQFEGEDGSMFENSRLPTLDVEIWVCEESNTVKHSFFEKPTCPNRVVQKDTALNEESVRSTLVQETVRRLKSCSRNLPIEEKQLILSKFAQKMRNSGFSLASCQYVLVHGVTKYNEMVRCSELPADDQKYKPLYSSSKYNVANRKLHKMLAKTSWYDDLELVKKTKWREHVPTGWAGSKPVQQKVKGVAYSSIMMVPNSKDGRLLSMLAKAEPRMMKMSGYQIKYSEKSGKALSKCFPKDFSSSKCFRPECAVCINSDSKKSTLCQVKGVVYQAVCVVCDKQHKLNSGSDHKGCYIGETARTLSERANEHKKSLKRYENKSFMFKHWALVHPELLTAPEFKFKVLKCFKDPLSRLVHEAVVIEVKASMNSRGEWGGV